MPTYRLDILVTGRDNASGRLNRIAGVLGRIGQIATGILIAGAVRAISDQIWDIGRTAVEAYADLERMQVGLESLIARELARGETVTATSTVIRHITEQELKQIDELTVQYGELGVKLEKLTEQHQEAVDEFGEGSWQALKYRLAMEDVASEMSKVTGEIEALQKIEGSIITVTETFTDKSLSLAKALQIAQGPARQLTDWIVRVSLLSPFDENDVVMALRVAAGYGFITQHAADAASEEERLQRARDDGVVTAQRLTLALLDLMAAIGLPSENLQRIVLALGQVRAHGKLMAQEIRQLINAGVGLDIMALAMDMTVEEFQAVQKEGKILADDFIPGLVKLLEDDLSGSAERVMATFGGVLLSFQKLRRVLLREFFGPTFAAVTPALLNLFWELSDEETLSKVEGWGIGLRDSLLGAWDTAKNFFADVKDFHDKYILNPWEIVIDISAKLPFEGLLDKLEELRSQAGGITLDLGFEAGNEAAIEGAVAGIGALVGIRGGVGLLKILGRVLLPILGGLAGLVTGLGWVGLAAGILGAVWEGNWLGIRDKLAEVWEESIRPKLTELWEWLQLKVPEAIETAKGWWENTFIPALQNVWQYISEDLLPIFYSVYESLKLDVEAALQSVVDLIYGTVIPAWNEFWVKLSEDVIPELETLYEKTKQDVEVALQDVADTLQNDMLPQFREWHRILTEDVIPGIETVVDWLRDEFNQEVENARLAVEGFVDPPLTLLKQILEGLAGDEDAPLPRVVKFMADLLEPIQNIGKELQETFNPLFLALTELFFFGILPVLYSFRDVLREVEEVSIRLWGGLYKNIIYPFLSELLAPILGDLAYLTGWWDEKLRSVADFIENKVIGVLQNFKKFAVDPLAGGIRGITGALQEVAGWLDKIAQKFDNLDLPWWALPGSPPPAAYAFWDIAEALEAVNKQSARSRLLNPRIGPSQGLELARFYGQMPTQGNVITLQGDTNTFYVTNEDTARLVAHLLTEQKTKRFNQWAGR